MTREQIFDHAKEKYHTEPEYLWMDSPNTAVIRRRDSKKWYGIIMDIPQSKVGKSGDNIIDVLNIKGDPDDVALLKDMEGFAPAYHMNKKHWLTVILDDVTDEGLIYSLIDRSYELAKK